MYGMNIRCTVFLAAASFIPLLRAAETGITFAGVLTAEGKTRIALTDTETKITTWVEPGGEFKGYTVARYDQKDEAVFLKKGGQEIRLGMIAAKTLETPVAAKDASPSIQASATAIQSNLRQLASAARQYQLERGVSTVNFADLVGPDKLIKDLKPVAGENYSTLSFGPNVTAISVTTTTGTTISLDLPPSSIATASTAPAGNQTPPTPPTSVNITRDSANTPASSTPATPASPVTSADVGAGQPTGRQAVSPSYLIQGGDTWEKISATTGVSVRQLRQLNPSILEGSPLPAGQTIRVR